jgi:hypothetical protein
MVISTFSPGLDLGEFRTALGARLSANSCSHKALNELPLEQQESC